MLVNELSFYELERLIKPVLQLQSMSRVCSEIGEVLGIPKADPQKIKNQERFLLRYKDFRMFVSDLRWLRGRGPSIYLQFRRPATKWQRLLNTWFGESHRRMDMVCSEVVGDLKSICLKEMPDIALTSTDVTVPPDWLFSNKEGQFRVTYPSGAFNHEAKRGYDVSPLTISDDYNPDGGNWWVSLVFNGGAFVRKDGKTILRENWQEYANDISKSIDAWVARRPHFSGHRLTFAEWCEDMILDLGDEVAPQLRSIWRQIQSEQDGTSRL
jgi:hypothetical protein